MASPDVSILPILPLPQNHVLLPGASLRIPASGRPDIPALLSSFLAKDPNPRPNLSDVRVGCVPLNSPLLRSDGKLIPSVKPEAQGEVLEDATDAGCVDHRRLFMYGTMARMVGVQGQLSDGLSLVVDGIQRFRIDRFVQMRPHFAAEITLLDDEYDETLLDRSRRKTQADALDGPRTSLSKSPLPPLELFQKFKALSLELLDLIRVSSFMPQSSMTLSPFLSRRLELYMDRKQADEAGVLTDFVANFFSIPLADRLRLLATLDVQERMHIMTELLATQIESVKDRNRITITNTQIIPRNRNTAIPGRKQRELFIRKILGDLPRNAVAERGQPSKASGEEDEEPSEVDELKKRVAEAQMTPEALRVANKELKRLSKMNPAQAEYGVCRTYIESLVDIPWTRSTEDKVGPDTLRKARFQLDEDHYGLQNIKKRLLEYLAVLRLKQELNQKLDEQIAKAEVNDSPHKPETASLDPQDLSSKPQRAQNMQVLHTKRHVDKSPILLLVGPPGTGKTSLAKSVALALGRKFHRISLGGVRDEAEIRGHRRTYVAAMPGLIISGLRKVGVNNPVFLLDEIDKVGGNNFHGDPSAAMLEVLDPEQNFTFVDHYVNIPLDLSKVLFIATANSLETIPAPLLDRMEAITLSGYTTVEKHHIAVQHLLPKQIKSNGLDPTQVSLGRDALDQIITAYTRESGVRSLEREIGAVCRFKAVQYAEARDNSEMQHYNSQISVEDLDEILGSPRYDDELAEKKSVPGIVTGLVAYSVGGQGSILFIEIAEMPGTGRVQLTGKLGDVLKESVEVALTWVKAHAFDLALTMDATEDIMRRRSIHVHCPGGAIPKDGPSAGLAHTIAMISLFSGKSVPPNIAMTGEISLRGKVMPVGGIKEKLIGAHRAGVTTVFLPLGNRKDMRDVPVEVKDGLDIVFVSHIWEALGHIWPDGGWSKDHALSTYESRL